MTSHRSLLSLVCVVICLLAPTVQAQISVRMKMSKSQYIEYEPVLATVTITNRTGRDLVIRSEQKGRGVISWLDFSMKNRRGTTMSPYSPFNYKALQIPVGRSATQTVDLSALYRVTELGMYSGRAVIRLPGGGVFGSNRINFNVTKGSPIYTQRVGDPRTQSVREYKLSIANTNRKSNLYVHTTDVSKGRVLRAFRVGEVLTFRKPKATVDGANNLHVLYLSTPKVYTHARVSPEGRYLGSTYYVAAGNRQPSLQTFDDGNVVVAGGIVHDPKAEEKLRAKIKRLSERPRLTFQ